MQKNMDLVDNMNEIIFFAIISLQMCAYATIDSSVTGGFPIQKSTEQTMEIECKHISYPNRATALDVHFNLKGLNLKLIIVSRIAAIDIIKCNFVVQPSCWQWIRSWNVFYENKPNV